MSHQLYIKQAKHDLINFTSYRINNCVARFQLTEWHLWILVCMCVSVSNGITSVNNGTSKMVEHFFSSSISCVRFIVFRYHNSNWCEREQNKRKIKRLVHCLLHVHSRSKQIIPNSYSNMVDLTLRDSCVSIRMNSSILCVI